MNQLVTQAIILSRTDYGEADRILTLLTPQYGKLVMLAKGVRRIKSKLAGGIELFSVSEITFIKGRGEVGTLVSTRLLKHYEHIVSDLDRTMLGYELIKRLHKATEDEPDEAYFTVMSQAFEALDDKTIPIPLIQFWFITQLLRLNGHTPNLLTDGAGDKLDAGRRYEFSFEHMWFVYVPGHGPFDARHIKLLRLCFDGHAPNALNRITGCNELAKTLLPLVQTMHSRS